MSVLHHYFYKNFLRIILEIIAYQKCLIYWIKIGNSHFLALSIISFVKLKTKGDLNNVMFMQIYVK